MFLAIENEYSELAGIAEILKYIFANFDNLLYFLKLHLHYWIYIYL